MPTISAALVLVFLAAICVCGNNLVDYDTDDEIDEELAAHNDIELGRKHKHKKFLLPIIIGALLVKSVLFPLAFKAMAVMSSISVIMSTLSLMLSAIIGFFKMGATKSHPVPAIHVLKGYQSWAKDGDGYNGFNGGYPLVTSAGVNVMDGGFSDPAMVKY